MVLVPWLLLTRKLDELKKLGDPVVFRFKASAAFIWTFPRIQGTLFWGPCKKDPTMSQCLFYEIPIH